MTPQWYFIRNKEKYGPYSMEQLRQFAASGRILPTDMLLREGAQQGIEASSLPDLFRDAITTEAALPPIRRADTLAHSSFPEEVLDAVPVDSRKRGPLPNLQQSNTIEVTDFLVPTNVSAWAIASCYMGFIGFCLPFIGLIFAVPAFISGIIALRKWRKRSSYGSVTSNIRAIIGLILSGLAILIWGGCLVAMAVTSK